MSDKVSKLIEKISNSKKYRGLYLETIERVVENCFKKYGTLRRSEVLEKEVEKRARNLLHQIWAAYTPVKPGFKKLLEQFKQDIKTGKKIKEIVLPFLRLQTSIKERAEILDDFYQKTFAITGPPESIIDWACGLNPLSWPWMNLPENCRYLGLDIDKEQNDFLNNVFEIAGKKIFQAKLGDILIDNSPKANVIFLLKLLPLLEHQQKGVSLDILKRMPANFLVVSFPTQSIGGRQRGMVDFYSKQFQDLIRNQPWRTEKILFPTELVFVIKK